MAILGELETQIMEILWVQPGPMSVRSVHESLLARRELAYTTVMTVLDRLAKKGVVDRERDGRAWLYVAGSTRAQLVSVALSDALQHAGEDQDEVMRLFVDELTEPQRDALRAALG